MNRSLATGGMAVLVVIAAALPAAAEFVMQERDGVLYVKNVAPPTRPATSKPGAGALASETLRALIHETAERHALAPALVESVIRVESNFEPTAVSPKGARGLMQLMPATAARLAVQNVFDVRQNIEGGVRHLRHLMDRYDGNLTLALAAYNAGVDAVTRHGGVPPYEETRAYVTRILRLLQRSELSVGGETAEAEESQAARILRHYETVDGHVVYSNLPIDKLSVTVREMLLGRQ